MHRKGFTAVSAVLHIEMNDQHTAVLIKCWLREEVVVGAERCCKTEALLHQLRCVSLRVAHVIQPQEHARGGSGDMLLVREVVSRFRLALRQGAAIPTAPSAATQHMPALVSGVLSWLIHPVVPLVQPLRQYDGLMLDGVGPVDAEDGSKDSTVWDEVQGLWDGFVLMAVPKKKQPYSRQRRRLAHYDLKNLSNIYTCPACGKPKLRHRICEDYERCAVVGLHKHRKGLDALSSSAKSARSPDNESRSEGGN